MLKDTVHDCSNDELMRVLAVNVGAVNTLNRELLPRMSAGSSVIYVGSTLSGKRLLEHIVMSSANTRSWDKCEPLAKI